MLARAQAGSADPGAQLAARDLLQRIASPLHFYGQLALEQLGREVMLPASASPPSESERLRAAAHPGLQRALRLIAIGLRSEGVREWNFSLIGMDDRQLIAAAQLACEQQVWDRCIRASERTQQAIVPGLRYPLAYVDDIAAASARAAVDAALVLGMIRQESMFVAQARSPVGASGLMQVMPRTARWTAKRIGLELKPDWRDDHVANLRLGTSYLNMVLGDFDESLPMALAAYNAGPNRPRRWREGATLEPAIWTETIPIRETRDYVKKVLSNAAVYSRLIGRGPSPSLRWLLGDAVGPREPDAPEPNKELP
jgi:soluble lytic murein transglycosylase